MNDTARTGRILESPEEIGELLTRIQTVAVLGAKPPSDPPQPAWSVPEYAQHAGLKIIPVPVYYPELTEMHGEPVFRVVQDHCLLVELKKRGR